MKRIILSLLVIQFVWATGCNDAGEKKPASNDSTTVEKKDSIAVVSNPIFATDPAALDPGATMAKLSVQYPELEDKLTKKVKFNYVQFLEEIATLDARYEDPATDIYLAYGAYTYQDAKRYVANHPKLTKTYIDTIFQRPCLLFAYKDPRPAATTLYYKDFGTLCPPPTSCSSDFTILKTRAAPPPRLDAGATIEFYNDTYNHTNSYTMTETVKFSIAGIKNLVESLDKTTGNKTEDIYFTMGAYTKDDAERYVKARPGAGISEKSIEGQQCLFFTYYSKSEDKYYYMDVGTICPPTESCNSDFPTTKTKK